MMSAKYNLTTTQGAIRRAIISILLIFVSVMAYADDGTRNNVENIDKYRFGVDFGIKLAKGLKLNIAPEFRFNDGFDAFVVDGGLSYRTFGCIYWGAGYRLVCDREESGTIQDFRSTRTEYDWEYLHRYAFDVSYKDDFGRFTPSFRLRYNNYTDADHSDEGFLRYRAKLKYDIKGCRFTPSASVELFQECEEWMAERVRYSAGVDVKINKRSSFGFDYKLDFFMLEYKNAHIFTLGYRGVLFSP